MLTDISPIFGNKAQELMRQVRQQPSAASTAAAALPLGAAASNGAPSNGAAAVPGGSALLAWTVKMALADNRLDEREQKMLNRVAAHHGVDPQRMEMLVDAARRGQLDVPEPRDRDQARQWLTRMADVSLWDGRIHREEFKLLCEAGKKFDYSEYDIRSLLKRRKTKLYEQARQRLKSSP